MASNSFNLFKYSLKKFLIIKSLNIFIIFSFIFTIFIHAQTGFLTRNYAREIPKWDDTRELLNWKHIAETISDNVKVTELKSIVTLNWYDSGQLSVALNHKYHVGVIGPNSNHFKYIKLNSEKFFTLLVVRLLNDKDNEDLTDLIRTLGYKINKINTLPLFRGSQNYGVISLLFIEKDY